MLYSHNMKLENIIITNDIASYGQADIAKADMVIAVTDDGKFFTIAKNRYGFTPSGALGLPISILPQVIAKPDGLLVFD